MDRRRFLSLFSAATLAAISEAAPIGRVDSQTFSSPAFGFSLRIPDGWSTWTTEDVDSWPEVPDYAEDADEPQGWGTPIIVFSRLKEPTPEPNAAVCVYGDHKSIWMGTSILTFAESAIDYTVSNLRAPLVHHSVHSLILDGYTAARATLEYDGIDDGGRRSRVQDDTMMMFHLDYLLVFQFLQPSVGSGRAESELEHVERSIQLLRHKRK